MEHMPAHVSILSVGSGDVILEFQPRNGHDWRWVVIVGDVSRFKSISRGSAPGMQVSEISEARQVSSAITPWTTRRLGPLTSLHAVDYKYLGSKCTPSQFQKLPIGTARSQDTGTTVILPLTSLNHRKAYSPT